VFARILRLQRVVRAVERHKEAAKICKERRNDSLASEKGEGKRIEFPVEESKFARIVGGVALSRRLADSSDLYRSPRLVFTMLSRPRVAFRVRCHTFYEKRLP